VIKRRAPAIARIDGEADFVTDLDAPFDDLAAMDDELRRGALRVDDLDQIPARGADRPAVAELAARLAVEGRLGGDKFDFRACAGFGPAFAAGEDREDFGIGFEPIVADEADGAVERDPRLALADLARFARARALLVHQALEAADVDENAFVAEDVFGQVEREAIGVVKLEGDLAGKHLALAAL
jgi:hypothetical protein